jgi:hypothetical protein
VRHALAVVVAICLSASALAQQVDPREMSGIPRPTSEEPAGTVSVRVIRGSFTNNVAGQAVEFDVDGKKQTIKTDANGRAAVAGLKPGANIRAWTMLDGARLETQPMTMSTTGIRVMLVGIDPEAAKREAADRELAAAPPVPGTVVFGPESRVVIEFSDDRLNIFYVFELLNSARTRVDIGGPVILDLPAEARGASLLEAASKQATVAGARVTVLGPFMPGSTKVEVGFELPYTGASARIEQKLPVALPQLTVLLAQTGDLDVKSAQFSSSQHVSDQGQAVVLGRGPAIAAGQKFVLDVTGLPHHPLWPRYLALGLAGTAITLGIWAAVVVPPRRRAA